jgi:hypothetical protein
VGGARRWRGTAATPGGGFALVLAATPLVDVRVWTARAVAELWGIKEVGPGGGGGTASGRRRGAVAGCRRSHRQWAGPERRGTGGQGGSRELEEEEERRSRSPSREEHDGRKGEGVVGPTV